MADSAAIPEPQSDFKAREAALSPGRSFIVQAPAGSGKTELLIQRYLGLLATVDEPEEIVAITFTRKAAAEMRERVLLAMAGAVSGEPPPSAHAARTRQLARAAMERDRALNWRIVESPARLRIQTIDALCASLTRQMPMLSRFGSQPESTDDAGALYAEAARATVDLIESKEPAAAFVAGFVERLLLHLDNNVERVEELLVEMLRSRDHWLRHVVGRQRDELEAGLGAERRVVLGRLQACLPAMVRAELLAVANIAQANLARPLLSALPGADDCNGWCALAAMLLTANDTWRKTLNKNDGFPAGPAHAASKQRALALIDSLRADETLRATLAACRRLPPSAYSDAQWQILEAIIGLLTRAVGQLKLAFQSQGKVDFTEVSQRALLALADSTGPTELALRLDYQIRHLLIDEFQDTSISQFELISRLTAGWMPEDGRTLFAVGDPMQSIYRFREAEVGLFLKARAQGIGSVVLEALQLSANFRSQAGIVDWVNRTFARVMPDTEDIAAGAVAYTPSEAVHAALPGDAVSVHPLFRDGEESEAQRVVALIKNILVAGSRPGIAILVRGRNHLREIVPQLQAARIPFRAIEIDRLDQRAVVQDLLALTRALAHDGDRLAWLAVLRAPWCGLTLADLHTLAAVDAPAGELDIEPFTETPHQSALSGQSACTIRELMHHPARLAALSADGRVRLARVRAVLEATIAHRLRASLREQVEGAWLSLGGPACVADTGLEDAETYLDHLEAKEEAGAIADFAAFEAGLDKLYALPDVSAGDDAVQIMTVHRAKGLEFDHVIVPGLGAKPPADRNKLFLWMERPARPDAALQGQAGTDLLLAPVEETGADDDPIYQWLKQLAADKAAHEDGRLLYVAATRARQRLHLLGETRLTVDKEGAQVPGHPAARSLLAKLWPVVEADFANAARLSPPPPSGGEGRGEGAENSETVPIDQSLHRLVPGWTTPAPPPTIAWTPPPQPARTQEDIEYSWAGETARHVGNVVHRWLQVMAEAQLKDWDRARVEQLRESFRNQLAALGVAAGELDSAAARVATALANSLSDERGRWLLGPQSEARNEYRLTALINGERRNLVIDRTFMDSDGRRWIVDYKTSGHQGADREEFLDREQARYREQLEMYAEVRGAADTHLGLYFPLLGGWREWSRNLV